MNNSYSREAILRGAIMRFIIPFLMVLVLISSCQTPSNKKNHAHATKAKDGHGAHGAKANLEQFVDATANTLLTNSREYTMVGRRTGEGYFSPDGELISFQSERQKGNPFYQIYVMNTKTGKTNRVSPGYGETTCSWIHPSKKRVMFSSAHLDPDARKKQKEEIASRKKGKKKGYSWSYNKFYDIFSAGINGRYLKRLTKTEGYDAEGSYSPDGKLIAFASNRTAYDGTMTPEEAKVFKRDQSYMMDIFIMNADGSNVKRLTTSAGYDGGPFFSPDGSRITWRRFTADGRKAEIFTMNIDGSDQKKITSLDSMSWAPFYHPSGDYLVFTTNVHGYQNFEDYIVDAQGKHKPVRVTFMKGFDGLPVFTPNGQQLTWTRKNHTNGESQIYIGDWDDVQARELLGLPANAPTIRELTPAISEAEIKKHIYYLASDELQGRGTGSVDEKAYQTHYAKVFKDMGLRPAGDKGSFLQQFKLVLGVELGEKNSLEINGKSFQAGKDWNPASFSKTGKIDAAEVVFVGYGIKSPAQGDFKAYNSYKNVDVKGKWAMAFRYLPESVDGKLKNHLNRVAKIQFKAMVAKEYGAKGLILVTGPNAHAKSDLIKLKYEGGVSNFSVAVVSVTDALAQTLLGDKNLTALQTKLDKGEVGEGFALNKMKVGGNIELNYNNGVAHNMVAMLKVRGATQSVVVGAHGDHLGRGTMGNSLMTKDDISNIHYGADDNASGVAGVLEIAHSLAAYNKKHPGKMKKNVIFTIWSGEEIGLLGSHYFVENWKKTHRKSLEKSVVAYINMDMIGRLRKACYVQATDSSKNWIKLIEKMNVTHDVPLQTQADPYVPSDGMNFYLGKVPSLTFFTGSHGEYHTPRDKPETINYNGVQRIVTLVKDLTLDIALGKTKLPYNKLEGKVRSTKRGSRSFRVYLGTIPDYTQKGANGVRISGATAGGPADKAGLLKDDVIVELNSKKIENIYDYVYGLQALTPDKEVSITVKRAGKKVKLKITPAAKE